MKEVMMKMNNGRVVIPAEFREKIGIKRRDSAIVWKYDEESNTLSIVPYIDDKVVCQITGESMELTEAIPLNKKKGLYVSRKGLLKLMDRYIVSKNGK